MKIHTPTKLLAHLIIALTIHNALVNSVTPHQKQMLNDIFSSAIVDKVTSLDSLIVGLRSDCDPPLGVDVYQQECLQSANNFSALAQCLSSHTKCLNLKDVQALYGQDSNSSLTTQDVDMISPALIFSLLSCENGTLLGAGHNNKTEMDNRYFHGPSSQASWGYSFLLVTLINLCALTGALVLPCMKMKSYKLVLMFMVSVAVGTLVGSGLLFLIPEAFGLVHGDDVDYIWKSTTIMGGIYLFYMTEKIMRLINDRRENTVAKRKRDELATEGPITMSFRRKPIDNSLPGKDLSHIPDVGGQYGTQTEHGSNNSSHSEANVPGDLEISMSCNGTGTTQLLGDIYKFPETAINGVSQNGHNHQDDQNSENTVAPVAYMIIFGDALHNFIDGLSIGSAFTQSIMTGVSVSLAVLCEELPHELGDFAILLNSGMRFRKALMYNFLSACTCYLGLVIGLLLGENTDSHEWIFAIAGGMFLYISLVDMMPEMNTAAEMPECRQFGVLKTLLLQNVGLLFGFGIMLVLALYGGNISFE